MDKFVNQPYPTKIFEIEAIFVFLEKFQFQYWFLIVLINFY